MEGLDQPLEGVMLRSQGVLSPCPPASLVKTFTHPMVQLLLRVTKEVRPLTLADMNEATQKFLDTVTTHPTGMDATLGLRYHSVTPDRVEASLVVSEHHLQPAGLVHGGVYCAVAESCGSVLGMAAVAALDGEDSMNMVVGVNNSTDFLHPVKSGVIDIVAEVIHAGRRTQLLNITMSSRGRQVARTTLRTMVVPMPTGDASSR